MSALAVFSAPIEAEVISTGMPTLVLGISDGSPAEPEALWFIAVTNDGAFEWIRRDDVRTYWRYDFQLHDWVDLKETDATQDDAPDGGESIPGSVPELDDIGESDPFDEEGRQTSGDPGDMDTGEDR